MLLAFLIDEIQELACRLFQAARKAYHARIVLWEKLRALVFTFSVHSCESLMRALADPGYFSMDLPRPGSGIALCVLRNPLAHSIRTLNKRTSIKTR